MKIVTTAGCGDEEVLLGGVCESHEARIWPDGFTINWHVQHLPTGRRMWRNGPTIRPTVCHGGRGGRC